MNEFKFACPRCGQKYQGDERYAGKQMLCPACKHLMTVPKLVGDLGPLPELNQMPVSGIPKTASRK
jgi:hypothetical protein